MSKEDEQNQTIKDVFAEKTAHISGPVEHTVVGMAVGAGIVAKESLEAGKTVAKVAGHLGKKAAKEIFKRS